VGLTAIKSNIKSKIEYLCW